jgi:hypothetical protein
MMRGVKIAKINLWAANKQERNGSIICAQRGKKHGNQYGLFAAIETTLFMVACPFFSMEIVCQGLARTKSIWIGAGPQRNLHNKIGATLRQ